MNSLTKVRHILNRAGPVGQAEPTTIAIPGDRETLPRFRSIRELVRACPQLHTPIIHGLLREGETLNIVAPPKTGKSWIASDLALSIASGRPWLGRDVAKGEVLILDNELHSATTAFRIPKVAESRSIGADEYSDRLFVDNLRGRLLPLSQMGTYFSELEPGRFKVIILDALYRFMEPGADENSNGDATALYNLIDHFAERLGCSFVNIDHTSKGNQAGKNVTDVGAGAGAKTRAADAHFVFRQHAEPGCFVVDGVTRTWAPPDPMCLRWEFPVWNPAEGLDPAELFGAKPGKPTQQSDAPTVEDVVSLVRSKQPFKYGELVDAIISLKGCSERKAIAVVKRAAGCESILNTESRKNKPATYTLPQSGR